MHRQGAIARVPAWAIGVSLVVHAAVLAIIAAPHLPRAAALPAKLVASLRLPPVLKESSAPPAEAVRPQREAAAVVAARRPDIAAPSPAEAVEKPSAEIAVAETHMPAPVAAVESPARQDAAPPAPDPAVTARYVRLVSELLARREPYPPLAARRGWEGEVRLRLRLARHGAVLAVQLLRSSGFEVLDRHALQLVRAADLPAPPAELAGAELTLDVPILYTLKRAT